MKPKVFQPWEVTPKEALEIQEKLKRRLDNQPSRLKKLEKIAAVDASYSKNERTIFAVAVVLSYPGLDILEKKAAALKTSFPYIPGLLVFREGPALVRVLEQVETEPDLIMFDGQGIAHPRGIGIATHLGILFEKPSIGVAKTRLVGRYTEPASDPGSYSFLEDKNRVVGAVLRTRSQVKPVLVSTGFGIDLEEALAIVGNCLKGYRLPEPIRLAHLFSNRARAKIET